MNKKTSIKLSMLILLVIILSISAHALTDAEEIDKGIGSMMFDVPETSAYQTGKLDKLIGDIMFDKEDLVFHPDFKVRINEIYIAAGLDPLYPDVVSKDGPSGLIWLLLIAIGGTLIVILRKKFGGGKGGKTKKGKKSKKENKILKELSSKFKNASLRLIDLFTGKHFREQEKAMQKIVDICDEFHKLAVHKDIYYVIEKLEKEPLLDQLEKAVGGLVIADEKVIHLIDKLLKLNKNQISQFKQAELSPILDPNINLLEEYEKIRNDLKEIKSDVMTRVFGDKKEGEKGLYRIVRDIDEIRTIVKKPVTDKEAERIDELVKNIDKETQEIGNELNQIRSLIAKFEGRVRQELFKEKEFFDDSDSITMLADALGYNLDVLKNFIKGVEINKTKEENEEKLRATAMALDQRSVDAANKVLDVVDKIIKKNEAGTQEASLGMYLSVVEDKEIGDPQLKSSAKQLLMFCDIWKKIKPGTKVLDLGKT